MRTEAEILTQIDNWAQDETRIRAVILTGSRADPRAQPDFLSDYDIAVYVKDWRPFLKSDNWLNRFGSIVVRWPLVPRSTFDSNWLTRLVMFEDGVRIDFQITEALQIGPNDYDNGYRVLVDKDGLTGSLKAPTFSEFNIKKPSSDEFLDLVNEFWWDATYVPKEPLNKSWSSRQVPETVKYEAQNAGNIGNISKFCNEVVGCLRELNADHGLIQRFPKYLWRNELPFANYMLDTLLKHTYLHRLMEWYIGSQHDWAVNPGCHGKWFSRYLDKDTWAAYKACYADAEIEENWNAFFRLSDLFGRLTVETAERLGYSYPQDLDKKITEYAAKLRDTDGKPG